MNLIHWLNNEAETVILQREGTFAMLTWKDFNQPPAALFTFQTAVWLFLFTAGVPLLMWA